MILIIGWFGTFLYLIGHAYISLKQHWHKNTYYTFNLVAAISLIISSVYNASWQAVVVNSFWVIISVLLLLNVNLTSTKFTVRQYYWIFFALVANFVIQSLLKNQLDLASLGWIAAYVFSAVYLLFSAEKMLPRYYLLWNIFAALALLPQLWVDQNWPVFGLEVSWAIISAYGAIRKFEQAHLIN
ncbi:hypothetical protein GCM10008107_14270 [Psychrosphaera saromensis]|uniref:CBU-0592-like domain-containing protein n=1 Tax=Psychrosphaera saromensis TaxID=716813 RepID=A0A2S7UV02_9GAMM|nr:hypothetical protein [Psychrosphaera saromensis]PQJ53342.1 hypothetical protein BTO11_06440 [Psychrosphaera saromensis]GHB66255.1 hypothetical protein GCM10008107_14270 [Psychrosphaera saromensis]GLQ14883.1 hypothetical protein GCM10007917_23380 [Psychrosphaera saromensis]